MIAHMDDGGMILRHPFSCILVLHSHFLFQNICCVAVPVSAPKMNDALADLIPRIFAVFLENVKIQYYWDGARTFDYGIYT